MIEVLGFLKFLEFLKFPLKIPSCACLIKYGLKFIFNWNAQVLILAKSLFKSLRNLVIFSTREKRDISSTNNFWLDAKSSDKPIMYNRKTNSPIIELCGTPASTAAHALLSFLRGLSQCRINYLIYHFLQNFMSESFMSDFIKSFRYFKKYSLSFTALIKRFINLMCYR